MPRNRSTVEADIAPGPLSEADVQRLALDDLQVHLRHGLRGLVRRAKAHEAEALALVSRVLGEQRPLAPQGATSLMRDKRGMAPRTMTEHASRSWPVFDNRHALRMTISSLSPCPFVSLLVASLSPTLCRMLKLVFRCGLPPFLSLCMFVLPELAPNKRRACQGNEGR